MSDEIKQAWDLCFSLLSKHELFIANNFIEHDGLAPNICGNILAAHILCSGITAQASVYVHAIDIISSVEFQFLIKMRMTNYGRCYSIYDKGLLRIHLKTLSLHPKSTPHKHSTLEIYQSLNGYVVLGLHGGLYISSSRLKTLDELLFELYKANLKRGL